MDLLKRIASNAEVVGGNKQVAQRVASGQFAFGLTDTDDAMIEVERGEPVAIVFPDQLDSQMGTLLIPNTVAVIKGGPNTARATRLVDRLLAADVEQRLAAGASAQRPLATELDQAWRVARAWLPAAGEGGESKEMKVMDVDFEAASKAWDKRKLELQKLR